MTLTRLLRIFSNLPQGYDTCMTQLFDPNDAQKTNLQIYQAAGVRSLCYLANNEEQYHTYRLRQQLYIQVRARSINKNLLWF